MTGTTEIPIMSLVLELMWIISFVSAIFVGFVASKKKDKQVRVLKGILSGVACCIVLSIFLGIVMPVYGIAFLAGTIGNVLMAFVFWRSPTRKEYIEMLQSKVQQK